MSSKWGYEEKEILELLAHTDIRGTWVNLACGDGRFMHALLKNAKVIATDIDKNELKYLNNNISGNFKAMFSDITKKLPFRSHSIDGVFCVGTLHLFEKKILSKIFKEINRIMKPEGIFIFDLATDIKRVLLSGENLQDNYFGTKKEPRHTSAAGKKIINDLLIEHNFKLINLIKGKVPDEALKYKGQKYVFKCNFWSIKAQKI